MYLLKSTVALIANYSVEASGNLSVGGFSECVGNMGVEMKFCVNAKKPECV